VSCAFCGYKASSEQAVDDWVEQHYGHMSPKDMMIDPVVEPCPECGTDACVRLEDAEGYQCLACGEAGDYDHCSQCGQLYAGEGNAGRCDDCWRDLLNRND